MADSDAKPKLTEQDITGLKFFDQLAPLLQRLHDDACERDTANNRKLFYDQYGMLMLLYFFNPIVTSLRGLQQASGKRPPAPSVAGGRRFSVFGRFA